MKKLLHFKKADYRHTACGLPYYKVIDFVTNSSSAFVKPADDGTCKNCVRVLNGLPWLRKHYGEGEIENVA